MLGHYKRVLVIGAHPDDEDTELLTFMVRNEGAEAAYLSLNRGEGGQNLIGPELGVGLGILRTEELLAARRLDGARQFFTRAYDFGFSKSLEDTWAQWPHDSLLKDVVRIVRRFRPQVIVAVFSGTPRDGHGQHQASGVLAREAFQIAADSSAFPELQREEGLSPWAAQKFYRSTRFDSVATTLTLDGGALDPATGRTYHQIAMASRSLHRSQDMGRLQTIGPSAVRLQLVPEAQGGAGSGHPTEQSVWDGVDTTLRALPGLRSSGTGQIEFLALLRQAVRSQPSSDSLAPLLVRLGVLLREAALPGRRSIEVEDQLEHLARAWQAASGVVLDARMQTRTLLPGHSAELDIEASGPTLALRKAVLAPVFPAGTLWPATVLGSNVQGDSGRGAAQTRVEVRVPVRQPLSNPYFLSGALPNGLYDWHEAPAAWRGLPFEPEPAGGALSSDRFLFQLARDATYRRNDQALGERRDPIEVVARVDVRVTPASLAWRLDDRAQRTFDVTLTHGAPDTTRGTVRLEVPKGWPQVATQVFLLRGREDRVTVRFSVRPPATLMAGRFNFRAVAVDGAGTTYDEGRVSVAYEHVRARSYLEPAGVQASVMNLKLPALTRVGYVRGAADRVPEALTSAGVPIQLLDAKALAAGSLDGFDAIVIGPRAYETEAQLAANNGRLLDYARRGGVLIVQYQQYDFFHGNYAPYPLIVGGAPAAITANVTTAGGAPFTAFATNGQGSHDRVTDERAPVQILNPGAPELNRPNRMTPTDWEGWVQERGLYFARAWDPRYRTLIETHDPNEGPQEGGVLVANVGKGKYVYTGLAFFRQLPAGVPGAYRLFANLLALAER